MTWRALAPIMLFIVSTGPVSAAFTLTIESVTPSKIVSTEEVVEVKLAIFQLPSPSYFRVAFQKSSGENYLGYIKNNTGDWIKVGSLNSDCKSYWYISDTTTQTVSVPLKLGESTNISSGEYQIRAHRFTATSCNPTAAQNAVTIGVELPVVTTDTPSPTKAPTNTSIPTSIQEAASPTVRPGPTTVKVSSPTNRPEIKGLSMSDTKIEPIPEKLDEEVQDDQKNTPATKWIGISLIVVGGLVSTVSLFLARYT